MWDSGMEYTFIQKTGYIHLVPLVPRYSLAGFTVYQAVPVPTAGYFVLVIERF
jgi:uncharacterized membrane protein